MPSMLTSILQHYTSLQPCYIRLLACKRKTVTWTSWIGNALPCSLFGLFIYNFASFQADIVWVSSSSSVRLDPWVPSCKMRPLINQYLTIILATYKMTLDSVRWHLPSHFFIINFNILIIKLHYIRQHKYVQTFTHDAKFFYYISYTILAWYKVNYRM